MATKQKRITFKLPEVECERIQVLSERIGRTMTDILREFIRTLPEPEPEPEKQSEKKQAKVRGGATAQDIAEAIQNTAMQ